MKTMDEIMRIGVAFHGHKCPAMPMGLRAGLAAIKALGVARSQDKELVVRAETGKGHAAGCFLDGVMTATGCTYGKSNIQKLYYNKMAFTLVDTGTGRSVRVSIKPGFFAKALNSTFVQERKKGVPPQEIPAEIAEPLIEKILSIPAEAFLEIGGIQNETIQPRKGIFEARPCEACGELAFVDKLRLTPEGRLVCLPCSGYEG